MPERFEEYGVNDQRSEQWHTKRSEMITASEITKAFGDATPSARRELLLKKIEGNKPGESSGTNTACAWGTQFEPIAKDLYCKLNGGGEVVDTSCVVHPVHKFLGASPDGIYFPTSYSDPRWGKLIEFKCPISRKFDENTPVPDAYYHQMQLQMECANIDECDYVEMRFATLTQTQWLVSTYPHKGRFAVYDDGVLDYETEYSPTWKARLKERGEEYRVVHWVLANWRLLTVQRDYTWLPTHLADLTSFWEEVQHHRLNGTIPLKPEKVDQCTLEIAPHDDLSSLPVVVTENRSEVNDLSFVRKTNPTTLQFDLP